jgi:prepilin-type N-terminal cleavage/methylation domain-containing protein
VRRTQNGFTVLELAITVTLSGILLAASVPAVGLLLQSGNLNSAVDQAAGHLRLARQMAAATGFPQLVVWSEADGSYRIVEDRNGNGNADSAESSLGPFLLPERISVDAENTEITAAPLRFLPDGSASASGFLTYRSERGRSAALQLIGSTGQVKRHK